MRSLLAKLTASVLAITIISSSQASPSAWNAFLNSSEQWTRSVVGLFSESQLGDVVNAQQIRNELTNWKTWPSSKRHKSFENGTWFLPFEAFQQQYYRGWQSKNIKPYYIDGPINIDLNGDGLQDLLYSKGYAGYYQASYFKWLGLEQYIILKRANGYELAYKCRQEAETVIVPPFNTHTTEFKYYGDCADTGYVAGTDSAYEVPWSPGGIWYQQVPQWTNSNVLTLQDTEEYLGYGNIGYDHLYVDQNINGNMVETFDRYMPKFTDVNGDGLPDILFFGNSSVGETLNGIYTYLGTSYVLYNTGHGFEIEAACIQQYLAWTQTNKPLPRNAVVTGQGSHCY